MIALAGGERGRRRRLRSRLAGDLPGALPVSGDQVREHIAAPGRPPHLLAELEGEPAVGLASLSATAGASPGRSHGSASPCSPSTAGAGRHGSLPRLLEVARAHAASSSASRPGTTTRLLDSRGQSGGLHRDGAGCVELVLDLRGDERAVRAAARDSRSRRSTTPARRGRSTLAARAACATCPTRTFDVGTVELAPAGARRGAARCSFALDGERVVGYAALERHDGRRAAPPLTASRRAYRRRGIAVALKRAQIALRGRARLRRFVTDNACRQHDAAA